MKVKELRVGGVSDAVNNEYVVPPILQQKRGRIQIN